VDDRGGCVVEVERLSREDFYLLDEGVRGQGAGSDNGRSLRYLGGLSADHLYVRVAVDGLRDGPGEIFAGDPQRAARRDPVRVGATQNHGTQPPQLFFEEARGGCQRVAAQGVRADQLGEGVGAVRGGLLHRSHLPQLHRAAKLRRLPGRLAPGETSPDHRHFSQKITIRNASQVSCLAGVFYATRADFKLPRAYGGATEASRGRPAGPTACPRASGACTCSRRK
jgi:hypothetical protein